MAVNPTAEGPRLDPGQVRGPSVLPGWSTDLCEHLLSHLAPRAPAGVQLVLRPDDHRRSWTCGAGAPITVSGHLRDLSAWMAGRAPLAALTTSAEDGGLPLLGPWP